MMMKRSISLVTALCLLSLCACAAPGGRAVSPASADGEMGSSVSFTDSLGSTITLEEAPQRVAALIGSYAETWVLAGGEDTLAAVTQDAYDERGLELGEDVTNVGSNQTPELEALFAAQPDLVDCGFCRAPFRPLDGAAREKMAQLMALPLEPV